MRLTPRTLRPTPLPLLRLDALREHAQPSARLAPTLNARVPGCQTRIFCYRTLSMGRQMARRTVDQVCQDLYQLICTRYDRGERLLPPTRELASRLRCALATVVKALGMLADEGVVDPQPRRGTTILRRPAESEAPALRPARRPASPAARLQTKLTRDLLQGRLTPPPHRRLPPMKQLAADYGVGRDKLRRVLATLVDTGYLQRDGRAYVQPEGAHSPSLTLHLIAVGDNQGVLGQQAFHQLPLLEQLEEECRHRTLGFRAHILPRGFGQPSLNTPAEREIRAAGARGTTVGFVICSMFVTPQLLDRLRHIIPDGLPVAFLDDAGNGDALMRGLPPRAWHLFTMTQSPLAGRIAARHLIERGHRRLAYITAWQDQPWSRNRWHGIQQACRALGRTCTADLLAPSTAEGYVQTTRRDAPVYGKIDNALAQCTFIPSPDSEQFRVIRDETTNVVERYEKRHALRTMLDSCLERALHNSRATAWLASSDQVAEAALMFLRDRKVAVPDTLSLLSFDDSQAAIRSHISSYNFNPYGLASAMVGYALDPGRFRRAHPEAVTEVEGFVRERRTVAACRVS